MKTALWLLLTVVAASQARAQDWAREKLEKSPRHHEWVKLKSGNREIDTFLVFPETKERATAVVVIHENRGLTDWVREVADRLAESGYIAIAPDLLSGAGPQGGNTTAFPNQDAATRAIYGLSADQVTADLKAATEYVAKLPAANGKVAVAGFCWGGSQSFRLATNAQDLKAAFVFYGTGPEDLAGVERIRCSVYGFCGGNDSRVGATVPKSKELMKQAGKVYEPVTYDGAGHGFMRSGEEPNAQAGNSRARNEAWQRWLELLKKL
jgi:carboxymethylenebutenolidase